MKTLSTFVQAVITNNLTGRQITILTSVIVIIATGITFATKA